MRLSGDEAKLLRRVQAESTEVLRVKGEKAKVYILVSARDGMVFASLSARLRDRSEGFLTEGGLEVDRFHQGGRTDLAIVVGV